MEILNKFNIEIKKEELVLMLGGNPDNSHKTMKFIDENKELIESAENLAKPAVLYDTFEIQKIIEDKIILENEEFESKLAADLLKNAEYAVLGILTIGPDIDVLIDKYMKEKNYLESYLLDSYGNIYLQKVGNVFYNILLNKIELTGSKCSSPVSPGQSDWEIKDQRKIFYMLNHEKIGVSLTKNNLLSPKKSVSFMVGVGKNMSNTQKSCDFCPFSQTCTSKKVNEYID